MVRGRVMLLGHDEAAAHAASKIDLEAYHPDERLDVMLIRAALIADTGLRWDYMLRDAGFHVFSAV